MQITAEQYVDDVLNGEQLACRWVQLACERHRRDLKTGKARGIWFDETAAKVALAFFGLCKHSKGEWAGRPVTLEPWQQFHIWSIFGWKRDDGTRRFRTSYLEVARKNGKSTMAAAVGLKLLAADGEPGAEIYTAATKYDQARIIHSEAIRMVERSPLLRRQLDIFANNINDPATFSKFMPLGADSKTQDGLNVHAALVDELHAHPTGDLWDVLETATGSRRQPLMYAITTAGDNMQSICYQYNEYTKKVLDGVLDDDAHWGTIYTLDDDDDWADPELWIKSNPNLGVSKKLDNLLEKKDKALGMPARQATFKQKELNIWVQGVNKWIDIDAWKGCPTFPSGDLAEQMAGRLCHGGLDLSSVTDLTAWVMTFAPAEPEEPIWVLPRFFMPEENVMQRVREDRVPYDVWIERGYITATPGEVIDHDWIIHQVAQDNATYQLGSLNFDRWGSAHVMNKLQEIGFTTDQAEADRGRPLLVQFGQGFASMSAPMKELEKLVKSRRLGHNNNPVLTWMADNLIARMDPAGNLKPDKERSREKIDGMVALIMGIDRLMRQGQIQESAYKKRGIRFL